MAKISNQGSYPAVSPADSDYIIGTDASDDNATKTFDFLGISNYVKSKLALSAPSVLSAKSTTNQEPSGVDTALQVTFGAAQGTVSDPVMLAADGTITFNQTGLYLINGFGNFERQGSSGGVTLTIWRVLLDSVQVGNVKGVDLSNTGIMLPYEVTVPISITTAGTELTYEIMRDSSGVNGGGLYIHETDGPWADVPSASIDIYKIGV